MKPIFTPWATAALTAVAVSFGAGAQAAILTFDPVKMGMGTEPYVEAGYIVGQGRRADGYSGGYNVGATGGGVGLNIFLSSFPSLLSLARVDGGVFALMSLDISPFGSYDQFLSWGMNWLYDVDAPQDDIFFEGWRGGVKVAEAAGSAEAASMMPGKRIMPMTFGSDFGAIDELLIFGRFSPNLNHEYWMFTAGIGNIVVESASAHAPVSLVPLPATGLALAGGLVLLHGAARTRRARRARPGVITGAGPGVQSR